MGSNFGKKVFVGSSSVDENAWKLQNKNNVANN